MTDDVESQSSHGKDNEYTVTSRSGVADATFLRKVTVVIGQDERDGLLFVDKKGQPLVVVMNEESNVVPLPEARHDQGAALTYDFRKLLGD